MLNDDERTIDDDRLRLSVIWNCFVELTEIRVVLASLCRWLIESFADNKLHSPAAHSSVRQIRNFVWIVVKNDGLEVEFDIAKWVLDSQPSRCISTVTSDAVTKHIRSAVRTQMLWHT